MSFLIGCSSSGGAVGAGSGSSTAAPPGQSAGSGDGKFISTTNIPPNNQSLRAKCTPTRISGSPVVIDYTLTITSPAAVGAVPIDVTSIAVFLTENGAQEANADYPSFSHFTLNPGQRVTLQLSSPLGASPGGANTWACALSGVNIVE